MDAIKLEFNEGASLSDLLSDLLGLMNGVSEPLNFPQPLTSQR